MWRSRLLILLIIGMLVSGVPRSGASANDCSGSAEKGHIGISASYATTGDTTTVTIDWDGSNENDMLVVDLDSRRAQDMRTFLVNPLSTTLFGLVLVRSASVTGSASFSYKRSGLPEYMRVDDQLVMSVYLTALVDLVIRAEDASVEGRENVTGTELTTADCSDDFQILCTGSYYSRIAKAFFPNVNVFPRKGPAEGSCSRTVPDESVTGFFYLYIAQ